MACNTTIFDTNVEERGNEGENGGDQEVAEEGQVEKIKHRFSEPWEDSDVILVVEDEKFHVHRVILSINSPVFKAMFKSQFKEATANEIPLPGKKANEVLDFLKKVYSFQYIKEQVEITVENVDHLLKLSDEFQVKAIFDPCVKFLEDQPKTPANVMKILALADLYDLDNVSKGCNDLVKDMKLKSLSEIVHFQDLDREMLQHFLTQRIERLETFLDTLYPQFMGLVACVIFLLNDHKEFGEEVKWCSKHVSSFNEILSFSDRSYRNDSSAMSACDDCREMFFSIAGKIYTHFRRKRHNGCNSLIDSDFPSVMKLFNKIQKG